MLLKNIFANYKIGTRLSSAFKEILFTVISILIALFISKWDEDRKKLAAANEFIKDINFELKADTGVFNMVLRDIDDKIINQKYILANSNLDKYTTNELFKFLDGNQYGIKQNDGAYTRMKGTDVFHVAKYEKLFKKFSIYYGHYTNYINNFNDYEIRYVDEAKQLYNLQDKLEIDIGDSTSILQTETSRRQILLQLINTIKGRNGITATIHREKKMKIMYGEATTYARHLIIKTDSILAKNK